MKKNADSSNSGGSRSGKDPRQKVPAMQDESTTRTRNEKKKQENPDPVRNLGIDEPFDPNPPPKPEHKPVSIEDPDWQQESGINKASNPASPEDKRNSSEEKSDTGDDVLRSYGKGL